MDEIFRSSSESPTRMIPSLRTLAMAHQSDLVEESGNRLKSFTMFYFAKSSLKLSETDEIENSQKISDDLKKSENNIEEPSKLLTSNKVGMKHFPFDFRYPQGRKRRNENSQSSFMGSSVSINITDENEMKFEHTPHDLFVQLNELHGSGQYQEWHETARWIKYEENVEEGADRWGQAHISPLSFHSLLNVRRCLETGVVMLDAEEKDFPHIVFRAVKKVEAQEFFLLILNDI